MLTKYITEREMLKHVGEFGKYQRLLDVIFCIMVIPQSYQELIMYFGTLIPSWRCVANNTICTSNDVMTYDDISRCHMPRDSWTYTENNQFSIVTEFDNYCNSEWQIHLASSISFISWAFGAVVLGWVTDKFGRRKVLLPSVTIILTVGLITAFLPSVYLIILARFIVGSFGTGTTLQEFILLSEFVGDKYRAFAGTIIWAFYSISLAALAIKANFTRNWRTLFIVCTAPHVFTFLFFKFIPESLRWLKLNGKKEEIEKSFQNVAKWNRTRIPNNTFIIMNSETDELKSSYKNLFSSPKLALKSVIQGYAWFVNGLIFYGISFAADDLGGSVYVNFVILVAADLPGTIISIYSCNAFGRKKNVILTMFVSCIACFGIAFVEDTGISSTRTAKVACDFFGKLFIMISYVSCYTWSVEIFETAVRGKGMGYLQVLQRLGAAASPWVLKGLKPLNHRLPFIVFGVLGMVCVTLLFALPETKERKSVIGQKENIFVVFKNRNI